MRTKKGTFAKGNEGKPKGAKNKITQDARKLFIETLESQTEHIKEAFDDVRQNDSKEYLELFAKYAQYFVPKKTHNENDNNDTITISFED
jgi:cation transport regulator ChaB